MHARVIMSALIPTLLVVPTAVAGKANGLAFDAEGKLLAADGADGGGRCIRRYDLKTGQVTIVADRFAGRRLNAPNDLCVDRQGRIYFTDPFCAGDETPELEFRAVYRVERDGRVTEITRDVEMPNGRRLAFVQTGPRNQSGGFEDWRGIPSNVEFGVGADAHSLYLTIDKQLCRIRTLTTGAHPVWAKEP